MTEQDINAFVENRKFYRNELYSELESYIEDTRQRTQTYKDGVYKTTEQIFPDWNMDKASEAMDLIQWLKKFVETDTRKLECL
ncbi:hypothetical protein [Flavobacterium sp.]|uniref:hypothetical protein n=1 Tax=Flavobacterium sp. TaxID=239 RepID=UPI002C4B2770|nr:hypothetical protein [Flavobacterium sp.]HSD08284.1 hypothetical protein [Flavobacterium sp.]